MTIKFTLGLLLSASLLMGQSFDPKEDKKVQSFRKQAEANAGKELADSSFWKKGGNFGIQFSQAAYSNWKYGF